MRGIAYTILTFTVVKQIIVLFYFCLIIFTARGVVVGGLAHSESRLHGAAVCAAALGHHRHGAGMHLYVLCMCMHVLLCVHASVFACVRERWVCMYACPPR